MRILQRLCALLHLNTLRNSQKSLDTRESRGYVASERVDEMSDQELLNSVILTEDVVQVRTDDTFQKAVDLSPEAFDRVFEKTVRSHEGFSGKLPKSAK